MMNSTALESSHAPRPVPSRIVPLLWGANVAAIVLVLILAQGYGRRIEALIAHRARAQQLAADVLVIRASSFRNRSAVPQVSSEKSRVAESELTELPAAVVAAGVAPEHLVSIIPDAPRPIPKSNLELRMQRISLEAVSMVQLATVSEKVESSKTGTRVTALQLRPARSGTVDRWDVEITIQTVQVQPQHNESPTVNRPK